MFTRILNNIKKRVILVTLAMAVLLLSLASYSFAWFQSSENQIYHFLKGTPYSDISTRRRATENLQIPPISFPSPSTSIILFDYRISEPLRKSPI